MIRDFADFVIGVVLGIVIGLWIASNAITRAHARPGDGWIDTASNVRHWFQNLVQPDAPKGHTVEWLLQNGWSCCGEADAYEADEYERSPDGNYIAIVTDTRNDTMRNGVTRPHDEGNPTPHGWVFLGGGNMYCYVAPGGV